MGTVAHTSLKLLNETGAKLLILVPGAGLEPARTLPGPRDFKSIKYCHHQQLTSTKTLYDGEFSAGMASFYFLVVVSLVTATVTVPRQPASATRRIARVWTDTFERHLERKKDELRRDNKSRVPL